MEFNITIANQLNDYLSSNSSLKTNKSSRNSSITSFSHDRNGPQQIYDQTTSRISADFDLVLSYLASNNLVILLFFSTILITVYVLCLLAHLRGCQSSSKGKIKLRKSCEFLDNQAKGSCTISSPFNLQMPPATRTRLELMMKGDDAQKINVRSNRSKGVHKKRMSSNRGRRRQAEANSRLGLDHPCCASGGYARHLDEQLLPSYRTLKLVRALRCASFLYRKKSHYDTALNVIPESEFEYIPAELYDTYPEGKNERIDEDDYVTFDQFDAIVQDAIGQRQHSQNLNYNDIRSFSLKHIKKDAQIADQASRGTVSECS